MAVGCRGPSQTKIILDWIINSATAEIASILIGTPTAAPRSRGLEELTVAIW